MRKVIIFGAGEFGKKLNRMIHLNILQDVLGKNCKVQYFCDNNRKIQPYMDGVEVIHPSSLLQLGKENDILISSGHIADAVMEQLNDLGIKNNVYLVPEYVYDFKWGEGMPLLIKMDISKPRLPYLECRIVMHCNLNCKGCSGTANISPERFMGIEEFEKNLISLKRLYAGIKYFKLFGGEPLLHPQLCEFVHKSREYFPDSELVVHSNGLLVPTMEDSVLDVMSKTNTKLIFTQYPPTGKIKRKIIQRLKKADVAYGFTEPIYEFRKYINAKGDYDPEEIYKQCCKCINLIDGTLSCGLGYGIQQVEDKFGVKICEDKYQHCINIHTTELDGWEINKILDSPFNLCAYCAFMEFDATSDKNFFPWGGGEPKLEDWVL